MIPKTSAALVQLVARVARAFRRPGLRPSREQLARFRSRNGRPQSVRVVNIDSIPGHPGGRQRPDHALRPVRGSRPNESPCIKRDVRGTLGGTTMNRNARLAQTTLQVAYYLIAARG